MAIAATAHVNAEGTGQALKSLSWFSSRVSLNRIFPTCTYGMVCSTLAQETSHFPVNPYSRGIIFAAGQVVNSVQKDAQRMWRVGQRNEGKSSQLLVSHIKSHPFGPFWGDKKEIGCLKSLSKRAVKGLGIDRDLGMSARPDRWGGEGRPEQRLRVLMLMKWTESANIWGQVQRGQEGSWWARPETQVSTQPSCVFMIYTLSIYLFRPVYNQSHVNKKQD